MRMLKKTPIEHTYHEVWKRKAHNIKNVALNSKYVYMVIIL